MEVKPIKRSKHILQLSKDHHFGLLFCWKIRQGLRLGVDAERIKKYVHYFWQNDLEQHFREEEEILFSPVRDAEVEKAKGDHQRIKNQIENILNSQPEESISKQLSALANDVDAHVRYEERELFPHLEKMLTEAQLEEMGIQLKDKPAPRDEYVDEFWLEPDAA